MKNLVLILLAVSLFFSCLQKEKNISQRTITKVVIETLMQDSKLNVRAIEINQQGNLGFAGANGEMGFNSITASEEKIVFLKQAYDTITPNFRSFAYANKASFALSIVSPALLYKMENDTTRIVYKEFHKDVFYDAMDFWNDEEGIAIGDSLDGCLSIIITRDGGETWNKLNCDQLPKPAENEGAFAASDTNIAIVGDKTWVATTAGRIYYSDDKGVTWEIIDTPIIKEKESEGIYSIDFYDELNGFAIGGDYTNPGASTANKIRTLDGGMTWEIVADNHIPGFRSCVQYVPNSNGNELVAIGFKGIDYSNDFGDSWTHLSDEGFYTIRFVNDSLAYAAGNGRISKLTFKE